MTEINSTNNVFNDVNRISIIGGAGTGKSTLTNILSKKLDLPAVHLDAINFKPNWVKIDEKERDRIINEKVKDDKWIIDGNYNKTLKNRLDNSDLVIWLDYSRHAQIKGVTRRYLKNRNKEKEELPGCKERFNTEFIKYVLRYNRKKRPVVIDLIKDIPEEKVLHFRKQKDLNTWLEKNRIETNIR